MFIDYYKLLEIDEIASQEEIKLAFRKQAIKWHPDRNQGKDTTVQMQRINEAYLILKDPEARLKFDIEYQRFKGFRHDEEYKKQKEKSNYEQSSQSDNSNKQNQQQERTTEYSSYEFNDDTLKNWMNNARRQSVDLAKQTIEDFKGMVKVGFKEGVKASGNALLVQVAISILFLIILGLTKSCHS